MLCGISDARWRASRGALTWAGGILMVCASALLVLRGASLWEGAVLLMAYLLVVMEVRT